MTTKHEHGLTRVGTFTDPTGSKSDVVYCVEWCETCKTAYQRPVQFLDYSKKRSDADMIAAHERRRADRQALLSKVHRLRAGESVASVLADEPAAQ